MNKDKIKVFLEKNKFLVVVFCTGVIILCLEYIFLNNKVNKKTTSKKIEVSNKASNVAQLTKDEKEFLGINNTTYMSSNPTSNKASNSNKATNNALDKKEETIEKKIEKEKEEKKKEIENENISEDYLEYEKLSDEEKEKVEVIPSKNVVDITELENTDNDEITEIPSKFNLADIMTINKRDQGVYGLCWDFSSSLIAETFMKLNYDKEYDFSEIAMDYLLSNLMYGKTNRIHLGGYITEFFVYEKKLGGLIELKDMNSNYYHDYSKEEYANILSLPRVSLGDYELVAFPQVKLSGFNLYDSSGNKVTEEDLEKYRENMKKHIMTNSAIGILIDGSFSSKNEEDGDDLPNEEYAAVPRDKAFYCTPEECPGTNHAVTIIGWDDNFDRRVFKQVDSKGNVYYPKNDGAFIVANSWDKSIFYYISYEDMQIYGNAVGIRKVDSIDTTKYIKISTLGKMYQDEIYKRFVSGEIFAFNGEDYVSYYNLSLLNTLEFDGIIFTQKDLDDLKIFSGLKYITIKNSNLTDLNFLKDIPSVNVLDFSNNNISDISALEYTKDITMLNLANNRITDISVIGKLKSLTNLNLDNNKITNYNDALSDLYNLTIISLENCGITDLILNRGVYFALNLSGNPSLNIVNNLGSEVLQLDNNNLTDLSILDKIKIEHLKRLSLINNDIKDISKLKSCEKLYNINLSGNKNIENLSILKEIFNKEQNVSDGNSISTFLNGAIKKEIDSSESSKNGTLFLNDCNISDFKMFNDLNVEILSLAYNNITSVDNFSNSKIKELDLSNNDLSNTDVSSLFKNNLTELYLSNTGIKNIEFDGSSNIERLDLSNNDITDASFLSKLNSLYLLSLENNENLNKITDSFGASFINLVNTGVDDTLIDKLDIDNIKFINLSNTKNINDMSTFLDKLYNKVYNKNEELKNKAIEGQEQMFDHYGEKYLKPEIVKQLVEEYVRIELLVNDSTIITKPYTKYLRVYGNYEFTIPTSSDGIIDLGNYENFDIFKIIVDNEIHSLHNVELDSSKTKVKVLGSNPYIELGNSESNKGLFRVSFK